MRPLLLTLLLFPALAWAGLSPRYGDELVVLLPEAPLENDPALAWSSAEVALAPAFGVRLSSLLSAPPEVLKPNGLRLTLSSHWHWSDGAPLDMASLVRALESALARSTVSLPPLSIRPQGQVLELQAPPAAGPITELIDWPWLRLTRASRSGAFAQRKTSLEAVPNAPGGAPMLGSIRLEIAQNRAPPPSDALAVSREGPGGRPVLVLTQPQSPFRAVALKALAHVDRNSLVKRFVKVSATPALLPIPSSGEPSAPLPERPLVLAIDASESAQRAVAERLQLLLFESGLMVRIVSEERKAWLQRIEKGHYDLALLALPPAPPQVQAATLLKLTLGAEAARRFWEATPAANPLEQVLRVVDAALLYTEGGGVEVGSRVRGLGTSSAWRIELPSAWMLTEGAAP